MNLPHPHTLLPQKPPMALIEEILEVGDDWIRCGATVGDEAPLKRGSASEVISAVGLEYLAQAGAVLGGLKGGLASEGMVISAREIHFEICSMRKGMKLSSFVRIVAADSDTTMFEGELRDRVSQELVLRARFTVLHRMPQGIGENQAHERND